MIIPLRGKLLVEIIPDAKKTESGLFLAETVEEVPHRGVILELGSPWQDDKGKEWPWGLVEGEIVHFKRNWVAQQGKYIILKRDEIFAIDGPKAVRDLVIIKRVYEGKIGNSSIVLPDGLGIQSNYEDFYGLVISVGPEDKMGIKIGDRLIYSRNEGVEIKGYKEHWSLNPRAILAIINQEET